MIAVEAGLWQFHATRGAIALALLGRASGLFGFRLWPVNARAVAARSAIHGAAMLICFVALARLSAAPVAAGLFTALTFALLVSALVCGHPIEP